MGGCQSNQDAEEDHRAVGAYNGGASDADEAAGGLEEARGLGSRIRLMIRCSALANMDVGSLSDPFVVVLLKEAGNGGELREIGRTEAICNSLSPTFIKTILMTYRFEEVQLLVFRVYDVDSFYRGFDNNDTSRLDLRKQDFIGEAEAYVASIMGRHKQTHTLTLKRADMAGDRGSITITGEEERGQNASVRLVLGATGLPAGTFSTPDVFVLLERLVEEVGGIRPTPCYKSEVVLKSVAPTWKQVELGIQSLCNADPRQPIRITILQWDKGGRHKPIGHLETTLDTLLRNGGGSRYLLNTPTDGGGARRKSLGAEGGLASGGGGGGGGVGGGAALVVHRAELIARPSFLDYIRGGCELAFMVAIDFTASNGSVQDPRSLHFVPPYHHHQDPSAYEHNAYIQAIMSVGEVLEHYDSDKMFPVFGFGGKVPTGGRGGSVVSHCFALNGNDAEPDVAGIAGVLEVYRSAIRTYELAGPTYFSEVIQRAAACATHCSPTDQRFHVLLIITDGIINDIDLTISSIIMASTLPMAILIVGVGQADFGSMDVLDGDEHRLENATGRAARDIVQFVPIRDFVQSNGLIDRAALSRALLDEIPGQLLSYMAMRGIPPNPTAPF